VKDNAVKRQATLLLVAGWIIFASPGALAGEIKVIANSSMRTDLISAEDLKRVFLEERNSLRDGTHVEPVLEKRGSVHEAFLREYLGRTDDDLQNYYRALVFTGRGRMPKAFDSDAEVAAYVATTKGAIGYVAAETNTDSVKTMAIVGDAKDSVERKLLARVEPEYPEVLKRLSIGGTVRLQVTVSAKGNVENVELLGGNPILGEAAISAINQWVYAPSHSRSILDVSISFDSHR
jgi:TonB family protein